jgi:hypothetical protein
MTAEFDTRSAMRVRLYSGLATSMFVLLTPAMAGVAMAGDATIVASSLADDVD